MDIIKLSKNLASIDEKIRHTAFNTLKTSISEIPRASYKKICYGLFFYYWHSDGLDNQAEDSLKISSLIADMKNANFIAFSAAMLGVLNKLWNRIDYHRTNKFLGLTKDFFKAVYKKLKGTNSKATFNCWNTFLKNKLFGDFKCKITSKRYHLRVCLHNWRVIHRLRV